MRRREFLGAAALPLLGCGDDMPDTNPLAPWHMWGTTKRINAGNAVNTSGQLSKINYHRPESWSFFFGARVVSAEAAAPGTIEVLVSFDLIIGVGRSSFSTVPPNSEVGIATGFAPFRFGIAVPFLAPGFNYSKFRTKGLSSEIDDISPTSHPRSEIDVIVAQDIQCFARARTFPTGTAVVEVSSYFAPRTHVRPDWFQEVFSGAETGGT